MKLESIQNTAFKNDMAALLAGLAAILTSITAAGGFNRRWRAYRAARTSISQLRTDSSSPNIKGDDIRTRLKQIEQKLNDDLTGTG